MPTPTWLLPPTDPRRMAEEAKQKRWWRELEQAWKVLKAKARKKQ